MEVKKKYKLDFQDLKNGRARLSIGCGTALGATRAQNEAKKRHFALSVSRR